MSRRWLLSSISLSWTARTLVLLLIGIAALVIANSNGARQTFTVKLVTSRSLENIFTPPLTEYFPETLLWQPELTTVKQGRTNLNLKLADYITTWKMSVFDSNETAEIEIRALQPFFAELNPPRVLTEGDRLSPAVVLRKHLDHKQGVDPQLIVKQIQGVGYDTSIQNLFPM